MVQFTNSRTSPVTISTFRINGADAGDFAQGNTCPVSPDAIPAGGACEIYVSFTPQSSGSKSATLAIGDDAVSSPQTVTLSGIGISAPQVSLVPGVLAFGAILAGDLSSPQTVTLTNTGSATLALSAIRLSGAAAADFRRTTTCDLSTGVPADTSCTIDFVFAPQSAGDKSVTLKAGHST